jgi:hypothetical protein
MLRAPVTDQLEKLRTLAAINVWIGDRSDLAFRSLLDR